jgi:peptidoglycan/xylan/chitin deacetylase (PgdA/CDA1 family)
VQDYAASARRSIPAMLISRAMLRRHLDWIGRRFDIVPVDDLMPGRGRAGRFRRPAAAITFDDGFHDVYDVAFPLLKSKGIPAAVFVVTSLVGTSGIPLFERLYLALVRARDTSSPPRDRLARFVRALGLEVEGLAGPRAQAGDSFSMTRRLLEGLPRDDLARVIGLLEDEVGVDEAAHHERRPLTWDMLGEMRRSGITIGSHTRRHALLPLESGTSLREETIGSRRDLEERLGATVRHFAYPNGWFDDATVAAVGAAGYEYAYTSCHHRDPLHPHLTLPRTILWERSSLGIFGDFSPAVMGCQADGTFDRPGLCPVHRRN